MSRTQSAIARLLVEALLMAGILLGSVFPLFAAETKLTFAYWGNAKALNLTEDLIKEFERGRPGLKVETVAGDSSGYLDKVQSMIIAGMTVDLMMINQEDALNWGYQGLLADLGPLMRADKSFQESDFIAGILTSGRFRGALYSLPRNWGTQALYVRPDHFDSYGLPLPPGEWGAPGWQWREFEVAVRKLTVDTDADGRIDRYGLGFQPQNWRSFPFIYQNGGLVYDVESNTVGVGNPEAIEAMEFSLGLLQRELAGNSHSLFEKGTASMAIGQVAQQTPISQAGIPYAVTSLPWQKRPATILTGSNYAILENSSQKQAAWDLLKFMLSAGVQKRLVSELSLLPVRRDIARDAAQFYGGFDVFAGGVAHAFPRPDWMPNTSQTIEPLWKETVQSVLDGQVPVRTALEEMARRMRSALGQ